MKRKDKKDALSVQSTAAIALSCHHPVLIEYWASDEQAVRRGTIDVNYSISLGQNKSKPLDFRVSITVNFSDINHGKESVRGKVEYVGYFSVSASVVSYQRPLFVAGTGAGILYSATRELIANISCRSGNSPITLPLASFNDLKIDVKAKP